MILGGNICDTYGVLSGHQVEENLKVKPFNPADMAPPTLPDPPKHIWTLNFSFLLKNGLI